MHPAIDPYQAQSVSTASPAQLVLMLYDRALVAIARAEQADTAEVGGRGIETVNTELQRAQDIVTELQVALDHEQGGEIATNLHLLYDFCLDRLIDANIAKDATGLDPVRRTLQALRDTWEESCCGRVPAGV